MVAVRALSSEVIVPVGYRNRFGHPKPEVLARYEAQQGRMSATSPDAERVDQDRRAVTGERRAITRDRKMPMQKMPMQKVPMQKAPMQ